MKKSVAILLCVVMLLCLLPAGIMASAAGQIVVPDTFGDNFEGYDLGAAGLNSMKSGYSALPSQGNYQIVESAGHGKVLSSASAGSGLAIGFSTLNRDFKFDFCYDSAYSSYGGLYVGLHSQNGSSYYFSITPNFTNQMSISKDASTYIGGNSTAALTPNAWYTCRAVLLNGSVYLKLWAEGTEEPYNWDVIYNYNETLTKSSGDTLSINSIAVDGAAPTVLFDNITATTWLGQYESFDRCALGAATADSMNPSWDTPWANIGANNSFEIVAASGRGNALRGVTNNDSLTLNRSYMDTEVIYDFCYDSAFSSYGGIYNTFHNENGHDYYFSITPNFAAGNINVSKDGNSTSYTSATAMTPGNWYTCRYLFSGSTLYVKVWPAGSAEPSAWDVTYTYNETFTQQTQESVSWMYAQVGGAAPNVTLDNIRINPVTVEEDDDPPASDEPQYTYFTDDYERYDVGTADRSLMSPKYTKLVQASGISIVDTEDADHDKVLQLNGSSQQPRFAMDCNLMDKQLQFDFLYDENFESYGGLYVTLHNEPPDGANSYYFSITPDFTNRLIVSYGTTNLGSSNSAVMAKDTWYTCKARLYDGQFMIKIWPAGEYEPQTWTFVYSIAQYGLQFYGADSVSIMVHNVGSGIVPVLIDNISLKTWAEIEEKAEYQIQLTSNNEEMGTVSGAGIYLDGTSATVTATTQPGYRFLGWYDGDELVSSDKNYTFTITGDTELEAVFSEAELVIRSFTAVGMTEEAVIDEENKTVSVRFASDTDISNVICYFYTDVDVLCDVEPYVGLDLSSGSASIGDWTVNAQQNSVMENYYVDGILGSDSNNGSSAATAFKTIEKAQEAVRDISAWTGDVIVTIANGEYVLDETISFTDEDGAEKGYAVIWQGETAGEAVISSGIPLTGWVESQDVDGAWEIAAPELPDGVDYSRDLYVDGERATLARGTVIDPVDWNLADNSELARNSTGYTATGSLGGLYTFRNPSDIEFVYEAGWTYSIVPVASIVQSGSASAVTMDADAFYCALNKGGMSINDPNYIQNCFEYLNEPGEWYFDRSAQKIYYIPETGVDPNDLTIVMPTLDQLFDIDGQDGSPVYGLALKDLAFRYSSYLTPHTDGHADIQANFVAHMDNINAEINNFNKTPGGVSFDYCEGARVQNCSFSCMSASGLDYGIGMKGCTIAGNRISNIGGSGIQVGEVKVQDAQPLSNWGYVNGELVDNLTPEPGRITRNILVVSNWVDGIGIQFKGAIGIFAGYASDVTIAHNKITSASYSGISAGWGWGGIDQGSHRSDHLWELPSTQLRYVIENNDISYVCQRLADGGSIYTLGLMPGSIIRGNYMHDNPVIFGGLYNDEMSGGFADYSENITFNCNTNFNYHNIGANDNQGGVESAKRYADTLAVMHDNFFGVSSSTNPLYQTIVDRTGLLDALPTPLLPELVVTGNTVYTVTFEDYDGQVISEKQYYEGSTVTVPGDPERTGHDFIGWSPTIETVSDDAVYTAVYDAESYTVTSTGGEGFTIVPQSGSASPVDYGGTYSFKVELAEGYAGPVVVKANGTEITAGNAGVYTITVTADVTIAVSGVKPITLAKLENTAGGVTAEGTFNYGARLATSVITKTDSAYKTLSKEGYDVLKVFEVQIVPAGAYSGSVKLTFEVGAEYNGKTVLIRHMISENQVEEFSVVVKDGKATITVTSLSPFAVLLKSDSSPATGDSANLLLWMFLSATSLAAGGKLISLRKKHRGR